MKYLPTFILAVFGLLTHSLVAAESLDYSIARGGKLYDKWYKVNFMELPRKANPAYPKRGKFRGKESADWRCNECHGWDYKGKNGVYGKGRHYTGFGGIDIAKKMSSKKIASILRDKNHRFNSKMLAKKDIRDLSNFIQKGQLDMDKHIKRANRKALGNAKKGKAYYQTICAGCHGLDGMLDEYATPMGDISNNNPWLALHKIMNGQPGAEMPAMRAMGTDVAVDILTYLQTLPKE